jgi:tRNA 2-thiouridine synthesizing protein E
MTAVLENVALNEEGFMTNPDEWTEEIAMTIAKKEGIEVLTEDHWKIINYCRGTRGTNGSSPTLREITNGAGITTKELFKLFPKGPAKKVAKISGLSKPEGCV